MADAGQEPRGDEARRGSRTGGGLLEFNDTARRKILDAVGRASSTRILVCRGVLPDFPQSPVDGPVHSLFFDLCATRWFFLVEFGRKIFINWLYIRGFRSDDGVPRPLFVPGAAASSLLALLYRS